MGIVVTIIMLLGLVNLRPNPWRAVRSNDFDARFVLFSMAALDIGGFWNACIYGFSHMDEFWGAAAIVSGSAMMAAGLFVAIRHFGPAEISKGLLWLERLTLLALLLSFLLYAVTLIQMNLGLAYLGSS